MSLGRYVLSRTAQTIPVVFGVILLNFTIIRLAPGDPALLLGGEVVATTPEFREALLRELGLDRPLWEQLLRYIVNVLRFDLGYSYAYRSPVATVILERIPATLLLMGSSLIFAAVLGIVLGLNAGKRPYSPFDNILTVFSLTGYSMPNFWLGLMLLLVFGLILGWLPIAGMYTIGGGLEGVEYMLDVLKHLILPAIVLGTSQLALYARLTRTSMIEVMMQDYITTARAKGCHERHIIYDHALKNAMLAPITAIGVNLGFVLSGAVLTETVFAWPGIGRLAYDAIFIRDYPVLMGIFIMATFLVVLASITTDIIYAFLDPRIRYR